MNLIKNTIEIIKEIFQYKELLVMFVWRDISIRYKRTILGILWVILQPLVSIFIFTILFSKIDHFGSSFLPYNIFVFIGLFYWNLFYAIVNYGSNVLINQEHIIKKIYFPREIIIISSCFVQCFDSFIVFIFLLLNIIYYKVNFNFFYNFYNFILVFIIGIIITIIYALSLSFILSILHGKYKDIRFVTPFILQLLLFLTPVVYSSSIITGHYSFLFSIHPIAITIEQTRNLIGNQNINYYPLFLSFFFGIVILIISIGFFRNKIANSIDEL